MADPLKLDNLTAIGPVPIVDHWLSDTRSFASTLARQLDGLLEAVAGENCERTACDDATLFELFEYCSRRLEEISSCAAEMRQELARSETLNHEQALQLMARSQESQTDSLTGLANRRNFEQQFEKQCALAQNVHCPIVVAMLDIDHFKAINDSRGHHVGDAVLRGLAQAINARLPSGTLFARIGGEEFALLLSGVFLDQAIETIEQLRAHIGRVQFFFEGEPLGITLSGGIAQLQALEHRHELLQRADAALYAAKQAGRNRSFWHDGQELLQATNAVPASNENPTVVELTALDTEPVAFQLPQTSVLNSRSLRTNWCDGAMLFWYLRQRIVEWTRGGEPFCVLAIDIDDASRISQRFGTVALHFMMRVQMLQLDAVFRDMDVIARTCHTKVVVVLPRTRLDELPAVLQRLRETMEHFVYPTAAGLLEYSISLGATETAAHDTPQLLVQRAEKALAAAQTLGPRRFAAADPLRSWELVAG